MDIRNRIKANLLQIIRARLRELVKRFVKLCSLPEISKCFASIEVKIKNCDTATTRKRATAPSFIDVELNIPDLGYLLIKKKIVKLSNYVYLHFKIPGLGSVRLYWEQLAHVYFVFSLSIWPSDNRFFFSRFGPNLAHTLTIY